MEEEEVAAEASVAQEKEAAELEMKELNEARKFLADPGRPRLASMASGVTFLADRAENRFLFKCLAKLPLSERCERIVSVCEEEGWKIRWRYVLKNEKGGVIGECCILSPDSSLDSIRRVMESHHASWNVVADFASQTKTTLVQVLERAEGLNGYRGAGE